MSALDDYEAKKRLADKFRREADKAAGALEHALELAKENHGVSSVEEIEEKLTKMDARLAKMEKKLQDKLDQIERDYKDKL